MITTSRILAWAMVAASIAGTASASSSCSATSTSYPVIDPALTVATPTASLVSEVDTSLTDYDRIVLKVDGKPFFYNGVQLRTDKLRDVWNLTEAEIQDMHYKSAEAGYTVVATEILWSDIQTDQKFPASESTYIQGGESANTNFASRVANKIGYDAADANSTQLVYLKFDFTKYTECEIDAAKIRIYINAMSTSTSFGLNVYGITNNTWDASSITWNSGAPNHLGANVTGSNAYLADSSPSYDLVSGAQYFDFDVSDFIINHATDKVASFIIQADQNVTSAAAMDGARGIKPPTLVLSNQNSYNYTYLDKAITWAQNAGTKMEIIWFGSDSTDVTMDSRVPYFVLRNIKNYQVNATDGTHSLVFSKNTDPAYGIYHYLMDKNDLTTRRQEKAAVSKMFDYIYKYNKRTGDKKTVIGIEVTNEPSVQMYTQNAITLWQNPATWWARSSFASDHDFVIRTMWEMAVNLANAVKESKYPVWTRVNYMTRSDAIVVYYNEIMRKYKGTSLDFVGLDPYMDSVDSLFKYGHTNITAGGTSQLYATGSNLPMVMENGGSYTNDESLVFASLAGGAFYNTYELFGPDDYGIYVPANSTAGNYTPVARGSYVTGVIEFNKMLVKLADDLATKLPVGANGTNLAYYNLLSDNVTESHVVGGVNVTYDATGSGFGIAVNRSSRGATEIAVLSTGAGSYTVSGISSHGTKSVESGYYSNNRWVKTGSVHYTVSGGAISFDIAAYDCIRVRSSRRN